MLVGIVDIGSNAVRFSVTDLNGTPSARNLPIVFQDRAKISLYDAIASSSDRRISKSVFDRLRAALSRFDAVCRALGVAAEDVSLFGTEASRSAANSDDLLSLIRSINSKWKISLLRQNMEAKYGALGIAASYHEINGVVMDLGGGSIQISWVSTLGRKLSISETAVSLPYGAAALSLRLSRSKNIAELKAELVKAFATALRQINLPFSLKGASLYLSGGGFRALGCFIMSMLSEDEHYPIPIINGYRCSLKDLDKVTQRQINEQIAAKLEDMFRISKRRAMQLPSICFLVQSLISATSVLGSVYFCQGGIKEGFLFSILSDSIRFKDPLVSCTLDHAKPASEKIATLLDFSMSAFTPSYISKRIAPAIANLLYDQASYTKDVQATAALNIAITGPLAKAFGLSHVDRALIGIILCERWGGEVFDERILGRLCNLVVKETKGSLGYSYMFWGFYIAKIGTILAELYPAAVVDDDNRVKIGLLKDEVDLVVVEMTFKADDAVRLALWEKIEGLEKAVKKFRKKYDIAKVPIITFKYVLV
ncbi:Ppx/GppA phosphatase family-domain-containing protein [Kockiozyma suomiensis]|uniref:Ppx/GppA phosphatase family-domain-containing protein n=1 Tax=Kockiozyma suomiensis TaxID=1337062 RepID=UPI003343916A